jgi:hypothetical protein
MRRVFFVERKNPSSEPEYTEEVNLKLNRRLETVSTQAKPTIWLTPRYAIDKLIDRLRGFQIVDF